MEQDVPVFDCERFLERKGWTRKDMARELGFGESTVGNWCSGTSTTNYATLAKMIGMGMTSQEMFGRELSRKLQENGRTAGMSERLSVEEFRKGVMDAAIDMRARGLVKDEVERTIADMKAKGLL